MFPADHETKKEKENLRFLKMLSIPGISILFFSITVLKMGRTGVGSVITPFITDQVNFVAAFLSENFVIELSIRV